MQQRSEETRKKILSTSLALFTKQGYDGTGLAQICSESGVTKGAFYHHFESKHDLFISLLESWLHELDKQLSLDLDHTNPVPDELEKITQPISNLFTDAEGRLSTFLEFWLHSYRDPKLWRKTIEPFFKYQLFFQALIKKGIKEGSLREVDSKGASQILISLSLGLLFSSMIDPEGADWAELTRTSITYLMNGIRKDK